MKPSRALDALVAEHVMGWKRKQVIREFGDVLWEPPGADSVTHKLPTYSTDIAAAWEVVEKMVGSPSENVGFSLMKMPGTIGANFANLDGKWHFQSDGETAPHAICLAALKAKGVDIS